MIAAAVGVTMIVVAVEMAMVDVVAVTTTADVIKALYPSRCEVCM